MPVDIYLIGGQSNATGQGYMVNLCLPGAVILSLSGPQTWEDTFILGINGRPLIAIKDRLRNAFRFILLRFG